jgi:hypothetical protein
MVWVQRKGRVNSADNYQVKGGVPALAIAATCGVAIIGAQLMQMFNLVPSLS